MGAIADKVNDTWRDFDDPFAPIPGTEHEPLKVEIREFGGLIDVTLTSAITGTVIGTAVTYATRAELYADLAHAAGVLGVVYGDATAAYNGIYVKSGASGAGSWAITDLALPATFATDIAEVLAQLESINAQIAAATAAATAAAEGFRDEAETFAAYAEEFSGPAYADTAAGVAATTVGHFFRVPVGTTPETYTRYERIADSPFYREAAGLATTVGLANPTGTLLEGLATVERSPADGLPNESCFWWTTRPQSFDGVVYASTCGINNDVYLNVYSVPGSGQQWVRRYLLGYVGNTTTLDDHQAGGVAVRAGKPLVVVWSAHNYDNIIYYRATLKNIDDHLPGEDLTFGPLQIYALAPNTTTSYAIMLLWDGDDHIRFLHRTGTDANKWSLATLPDWATGTPSTVEIYELSGQYYTTGRVVGDTIKCLHSGHPTLTTEYSLRYSIIDLVTGSITESDGTVLGNLDGTNLPLAHADLELIHTSTGGARPWGMDVSTGADHTCVFVDGQTPPNFASTAEYKFARLVTGSWVVNDIVAVGSVLSGAYFPSLITDPVDVNAVYLVRYAASVGYLERHVTADNGATWTATEIESAPFTETTLSRPYAVELVDVVAAPFALLITEIDEYPTYNEPWIMRVRPSYPAAPVKRLPDVELALPATAPAAGLYLPGTSGTYLTATNATLGDLIDGIRFEVECALTDWSTGSVQALAAKEASSTARSAYMYVGGDGKIGLAYSIDGTTSYPLLSNILPPAVNGEFIQLAVDFIPQFNATQLQATFSWRLADTDPWTQFDRIRVVPSDANPGATWAPLYDSSSILEVGSRWTGASSRAIGIFRRAAFMSPGREMMAEWRADNRGTGTASVDYLGNIWTLNTLAYGSAWNDANLLTRGSFKNHVDVSLNTYGIERLKIGTPASAVDGVPVGSIWAVTTVAGSGTASSGVDVYHLNAGSPVTLTLPSAVTMGLGKRFIFKAINGGTQNIGTTSSQTIDGAAAPYVIRQGDAICVESDGSNWRIIWQFITPDTGWTAATGTANKGAYAAYVGQNVSAAYVEAEAQATDDAVRANSQRIKALEDALRSAKIIT